MLDHFNNSFSLSVWGFFLTSRSLSTLIQTHHPWSVLRKSRLFSSFIWLCLVSLIDNANWVQDPILHIFISSADRPLCVTFFLSKARQWRYLCTVTAQHQHWLCCNVHSHIQWASVCFWGATAAALCVVMCWHMEADSYQTSPVWLSVPPVRLGWARSALESDLSPLGSKWMQSAGVCHSPLREYQDFAGWLLGSSDVESNSIFILCMSFVLFRSCLPHLLLLLFSSCSHLRTVPLHLLTTSPHFWSLCCLCFFFNSLLPSVLFTSQNTSSICSTLPGSPPSPGMNVLTNIHGPPS